MRIFEDWPSAAYNNFFLFSRRFLIGGTRFDVDLPWKKILHKDTASRTFFCSLLFILPRLCFLSLFVVSLWRFFYVPGTLRARDVELLQSGVHRDPWPVR